MLNKAKNRICSSVSCNNWLNMRRQPCGEAKGNKPSITNTKASAIQSVSLFNAYFFAGPEAPAPRNTLKNSEDDGSTTITSFLLAKDAL